MSEKVIKIEKCRICGNKNLERVLELGTQSLTGVFPNKKNASITEGPLNLVKCVSTDDTTCGLLQLEHSYDLGEMYGLNYGYRSGLNPSMVAHLKAKIAKIVALAKVKKDDLIIDIGSNDSTSLQAYPSDIGLQLVGVDPTGVKFHSFYPKHIQLIPDFYTSRLIKEKFGTKKAKVITSFSMFYDLETPLKFMEEIRDVLAEDGVWVFEQSYMPTMLEMNSYDTVCHEHLEYYAMKQIKFMCEKVGFKIVDVEFNDVNGGSFSVTATHKANANFTEHALVEATLKKERELGLDTLKPYIEFKNSVKETREQLLAFTKKAKSENKMVAALGASTKGNVLLQYCGLTESDISFVGEVNPEKYGCFTPGTEIPIISETDLIGKNPDYLIVLPWHFRKFFVSNKKLSGSKLVIPLPNVEVL